MEIQDIYDRNRNRTGLLHRRGTPLTPGDYVLTACVWVTDGRGHILLTLRAPEKESFPNTWENSGGAVRAGETSRQAIARELFEETGLWSDPEEFFLLTSSQGRDTIYDFYVLKKEASLEELRLQPGETADARWVTLAELHAMIDQGTVALPIARHFLLQEPLLMPWVEGR